MGKERRLRTKYHISRKKSESGNDLQLAVQNDKTVLPTIATFPTFVAKPDENIFAGIVIKDEDLKQTFLQDDTRSVVSTSKGEFKKKIVSKKERRRARHDTFINKITAIQKLKQEEKEKRKRQRKAVTGDLKPLIDSLPVVESLETKERKRPPPKKRSVPKLKWRQKIMLRDVASFKKLLQNPAFKEDPSSAVTNIIQEKIIQNLEKS